MTAGILGSHAIQTRRDVWTQGMRRDDRTSTTDWRQLLFNRLDGRESRIRQGRRTEEAEHGLNLESSSYYFIDRCEPAYGDRAVAFDHPLVSLDSACVTPFDTGGLWHDRIETQPPRMTAAQKTDIVERFTFSSEDYLQAFIAWGKSAFSNHGQYCHGSAPSHAFCPEIRLSLDNMDARSWTWEGRVPKDQRYDGTLSPIRLFLAKKDFELYARWVTDTTAVPNSVKLRHQGLLARIYRDPGEQTASEALNSWIEGRWNW